MQLYIVFFGLILFMSLSHIEIKNNINNFLNYKSMLKKQDFIRDFEFSKFFQWRVIEYFLFRPFTITNPEINLGIENHIYSKLD